VSYAATSNGSPRAAQQAYFKPKLSLSKKLGAFFGSGTSSGGSGRVVMGRATGIGSQDVLPLAAPSGELEPSEPGAALGPSWAPHAHDRSAASASTSSFATVPPSPTVSSGPSARAPSLLSGSSAERAPSAALHSSSSPVSATASSPAASAGLDALLARFEQEDKERFRGIAAARAQDAVLRRGGEGVAVA